jgi:hypothetical protein
MLDPNTINIIKEQNDNVTIHIDNEKSFNLLSESYLTKQINSVTVRGKDGSIYYEFFYESVNSVTRKDGTVVLISDNDILFDELNQFFFFINNEGGGPIPPGLLSELPIGNFIFVNPLGDDATGLRNRLDKPFKTLNAAKNAAAPNLVTGGFIINSGTGYPLFALQTDVPTTGGSGIGLTVDYSDFGGFTSISINNPGSGYLNGEVVTITGGNNDKTYQLNVEGAVDTVYVYGGTFNEGNQLYKENVKWSFIGNPTINLSNSNVFDVPVNGLLNIEGDANFNHIGIGRFIRVLGTSTGAKVFLNCRNLTGNGQQVLGLYEGSGVINISEKLECTLIDRCIQLGGNASYVFNIDEILNSAFIGGVSNAINFQNQLPVYAGFCVFNCRKIQSGNGLNNPNGATISFQYGPLTGTAIFNITDKIYFAQTGIGAHSNSAIQMLSGNCVVNGNIDGGEGIGINMETKFFPKNITHNGNAWNNGTNPLVDFGDLTPSFWSGGVAEVKLNGEYKSANDRVVYVRGEGNNKITIKGKIESEFSGITTNWGVFLADNVSDSTIFEDTNIIMTNNGTPESIGSDISKNIKLFHSVGTNKNASVNITNLIPANNLTVDSNYE